MRDVSDLAPLGRLLTVATILLVLGCGTPQSSPRPPTLEVGQTGSVAKAVPQDSSTSGLAAYPDDPLPAVPPGPISPRFLAEHRSALNGRVVELQAVVVFALIGDAACPPASTRCAEPRIILAETPDPGRNHNYDVLVLVRPSDVPVRTRPEDTRYHVGDQVQVRGMVQASKVTVLLRKVR